MPGSQNPNVVNIWDPLSLDNLAPNLPQVGTDAISPVFPVPAEWLDVPMIYGTYTVSLNGATASVDMSDLTEILESPNIDQTQNQIWHSIFMKITGGTVSPIICTASYTDGTTAQPIVQTNVTNTGFLQITGLFSPNNIDIRLGTATNGGAGDTLQVFAAGIQQKAGVPILPYSPVYQTGTV